MYFHSPRISNEVSDRYEESFRNFETDQKQEEMEKDVKFEESTQDIQSKDIAMLIQIVDSYSHKNRDKPMNIPLQQAMSSTLLQEIEEVEQANEQELMMHRMSERVRHDTE